MLQKIKASCKNRTPVGAVPPEIRAMLARSCAAYFKAFRLTRGRGAAYLPLSGARLHGLGGDFSVLDLGLFQLVRPLSVHRVSDTTPCLCPVSYIILTYRFCFVNKNRCGEKYRNRHGTAVRKAPPIASGASEKREPFGCRQHL